MSKYYVLMNKDSEQAYFKVRDSDPFADFGNDFVLSDVVGNLPLGFTNINSWIENRKGSKHSQYIKDIMTQIGCETTEDYLRLTHTASINDTFWVKSESEDVTWNNISLYENEFSEVVSKLAFEGVGLYNVNFPSTSPEFTCEGSYRKCFRKNNNLGQYNSNIYIYKRGGDYNKNFEVYSEILSSEIAQIISPYNSVNYDLVELHGNIASKCNVFSNDKYGFASYAQIRNNATKNLKDIVRYFSSIGSEQQIRELLVIDALCFNPDRHLGNFGVLFDNDTLSVVSISPVFDFNLSLLYSCNTNDLKNQIGDCLYNFTPALYSDFTRMGQLCANGNDKIQDRLKDLKDFTFSFRGDDVFPEERIKVLERSVQLQATAILSSERLYTKDVFFSKTAFLKEQQKSKSEEAFNRLNEFDKQLSSLMLSEDLNPSITNGTECVEYLFENYKCDYEFVVDFLNNTMFYRKNQKVIPSEKIKDTFDKEFLESCATIEKLAKPFLISNPQIEQSHCTKSSSSSRDSLDLRE